MDTSSSEEESGITQRSPFEVVLRGGQPWGFELRGGAREGTPLQVCEIAARGKAHISRLEEGDVILGINRLACSDTEEAQQLIESAFRTLTLKVWRGNYESSNASRPPAYPGKLSVEYRADESHVHIQDDSALYRQSKSSQSQAKMRPRQRRGESFNVSKSTKRHEEKRTSHDPPWQQHPPDRGSSQGQGYVSQQGHQDPRTKRRYSEAPDRRDAVSPGVSRSGHLVSAKSTPSLNQNPQGSPAFPDSVHQPSISPAKSSPNISEEIGQDTRHHGNSTRPNRLDIRNSNYAHHPPSPSSAWSMYQKDQSRSAYHKPAPNMYTSDDHYEPKPSDKYTRRSMPPHLGKYQADYENINNFGTTPLHSEKISEIEDEEADLEAPVIPPRPKDDYYESHATPPVPPVRDPSSLQYGRYNQAHEKYPSWPVTKPNEVGETGQPITARAQSWTDHTNSKKEVPAGVKPRYLHNPSLMPVFEKSSQPDKKGEDGKSSRNQSDPGFKTEFVYGKYGKVVQKNYENIGKNKFEDLINSEPGYPPPKFDSDGHNFGDKEYSVPSPPERDIPGVDQTELSDKLTSSQTSVSSYQASAYSSQFEKDNMAHNLDGTSPMHSPGEDPRAPLKVRSLKDKSAKEKTLVDSSTSPLQSPQDTKKQPKFGVPSDQPSAQLQQSKAYIVKQTPYYNTSTQTDVSSYAIKTSVRSADPKQCNAEVQATEVSGEEPTPQHEAQKSFEEKSMQARLAWKKQEAEKEKTALDAESGKGRFSMGGSTSDKPKYYFDRIQAKYAADDFPEEPPEVKKKVVVPHYSEYDPSTQSMLRSLSKEYYGGRLPSHHAEKRFSSASSHDASHHTGMKEAESYNSVVIHPSENSGPFGRDDFGSKSSLSDSRCDVSSVSDAGSRSSMSRGRYSLDPSVLSHKSRAPFSRHSSASSVGHTREKSASYAESVASVQRRSKESSNYRPNSYHSSDSSTPSQPKSSTDTRTSGSTQYDDSPPAPLKNHHDNRIDSYPDSVFDEKSPLPREGDSQASSGSRATEKPASVGRQPSMKKAYGIYDETEGALGGRSDNRNSMQSATDYVQMNHPSRNSSSGHKHLDQIQEEGDSALSKQRVAASQQESFDSKYRTDWRATRDRWRDEAKRTNLKRTTSEQIPQIRDNKDFDSFSDNDKVGKDSEKGSFKDNDRGSYRESGSFRDSMSSLGSGKESRGSYRDDRKSFKDSERPESHGSYKDLARPEIKRGSYKDNERPDNNRGSFKDSERPDNNRGSFKDSERPDNNRGSFKESERPDNNRGSYKDSERPDGSRGSYKDGEKLDSNHGSYKDSDKTLFKQPERGSQRERSDTQPERARTSSIGDPQDSRQSLSEDPNDINLKLRQQQAVRSFMEMKTGKKPSTGSLTSDDVQSADTSNLYEYVPGTSPTQSVTDLINKASENLNASKAHRADSLRRSESSASSRHSGDYIDMARQQRKETEWSRLRSQGSFNYSPDLNRSNRSSLCSDHQYEDISVFSPATPRNSYPGSIREEKELSALDAPRERREAGVPSSASMDSGLRASPTYQNLYTARRPPPPIPTRSPSPEDKPPALPPRNYRRRSEGTVLGQRSATVEHDQKGEENIDRTKRDFGDLKRQFENSPQADMYVEKLRMESRRMSAQPMTIKYSKPNISYPTVTKREPMMAQEATSPSSEQAVTENTKSHFEESNKENSAPSQPTSAKRERTLSDIPPPSPPKLSDAELISDGEELPPPPPDLLQEEDDEKHDGYADDSYMSAAVRRSRRNSGAGNYKRSASAAALRPGEDDSERLETEANSLFSDKKLGYQTWNSESALTRHSINARSGRETLPNLPGNVPAFKADVEVVKNVSRGTVQPLQAQPLQTQSLQVQSKPQIQHAQPMQSQQLQSQQLQTQQLQSQQAQYMHAQQVQTQSLQGSSGGVAPQSLHLGTSSSRTGARPPQTLSSSALSSSTSSNRPAQLHSPLSTSAKSMTLPATSSSARNVPHPSPTNPTGGSFITPVVKPVQSPSGGNKPAVSLQSPSALSKSSSLFSPRPFVSHHSRESGEGAGESKQFSTPNSVRDRISKIEHSGNKNVRSPRFEPNKMVSPKHTASPKPVDSSWKTNPDQIRTSSPKTVGGGQLKADSSWETMENLSQSPTHKLAQSVSQNNSQNSQRILESWKDDQSRSRYPRNESFSSSSSNSTVSSSERRQNSQEPMSSISERRHNLNENPAYSATSPVHQQYRHFSPIDQSAQDNRSPRAQGQSHSAYNQKEPKRYHSSAQKTTMDVPPSQGPAQSRLTKDSRSLSPGHRRPREIQSHEQDTNGVHYDGDRYSPRSDTSSRTHRTDSPVESRNVLNNRRNGDTSDSPTTQDNNNKHVSNSQLEMSDQNANRRESMDVPIQHGRQRSQEEIECDEQAKQLAPKLAGVGDKKLSEVLTQDHKRMKYMDGMFNEPTAELNRRPSSGKLSPKGDNVSHERKESLESETKGPLPASYFKGSSKALVEMEVRRNEEVNKDIIKDLQDNDALKKQKEELMEKLYAKLKVLKEEKLLLQQEIDENEALGRKVCECVEKQARTQAQKDKFNRFLDELEKIVRLMLNLSGQLARAENAVQSLGQNTDAKIKKLTIDKRERLHAKYQDAKGLKQDIDERSDSVAILLQNFLSDDEFEDYSYFIKMKSKLTIDCQDLDDKIALGEEQIQELKKSIPDN